MTAYAAIKERLVNAAAVAVVGIDDELSRQMADRVAVHKPGSVYRFTVAEGTPGNLGAELVPDLQPFLAGTTTLRGRHNLQNATASALVCRLLGVDIDAIARGLKTYPGLPHRMEEVGILDKPGGQILFLNDSKATNADSTEKALASFSKGIHWILGGKPKEGGITGLAPYFPRISKAYLIGQASDDFAATLAGKVEAERCGTLDVALDRATKDALASADPEPVVLLSPACASYDQFRSFEHRGTTFRDLVDAIAGVRRRPDARA
jgi:UDP-N-acetylmuramoylalanine--D-glutamate ligase